jgi:hypothetical protein
VNALFAAAADVQAFCSSHGWKSAVIGGVAVQRWGEPRQTRDVDLTILTGLGGEERVIDPLLAHYAGRIANARQFAIEHRVVLVETSSGVPVDISLAGLPFEARVIARSTRFEVEQDTALVTCSAEDLVVLKAFAGRAQDWLDIEGIVVRQGARLHRGLVLEELRPLLELKEDPDGEGQLRRLFEKHSTP